MDTPRIFVTGATGFVGLALCRHLMMSNMSVCAATRISVSPEVLPAGVDQYAIGEIGPETDCLKRLEEMDVVIHLAARVHMMRDTAIDPLAEFMATNFHGTIKLARQAAAAGVKRFVYVSSIKVNGEYTEPNTVFTEDDEPNPLDAYAVSKYQAEQGLHEVSRDTGMEVVIVRPPLIYGPNVKANFAKLLSLIDRGIPLPLKSIRNSRSLVYVDNLVDALARCATHPAAAGQTYLISDGEDVSTPQLIHAIAVALHRQDRLFAVPIGFIRHAANLIGKSGAVGRLTQSLVIDSGKVSKELDWSPPYTMAQGLQATADWHHQFMKSAKA